MVVAKERGAKRSCFWRGAIVVSVAIAALSGAEPLRGGHQRIEFAPEAVVSLRPRSDSGAIDAGSTYRVHRGATQEAHSALLIRYDLSDSEWLHAAHGELSISGRTLGQHAPPSFVVTAVGSDWDPASISLANLPESMGRVAEVTFHLNQGRETRLRLPLYDHFTRRPAKGKVSFLIEMRNSPDHAEPFEFSGEPLLTLAKDGSESPDAAQLLRPIWKGSRVVDEPIQPLSRGTGWPEGNLAFVPERILSVRSFGEGEIYEDGRDFIFEGRTLRSVPGSRMPSFRYEELHHGDPDAKPGVVKTVGGKYLTFAGGDFFIRRQIAVSYEHASVWEGPLPASAENLLPGTFEKLHTRGSLKIVLFGDSISVGGDSSGQVGVPPFLPRWSNLVESALRRAYATQVDVINASLGGTTSDWGVTHVDGLVTFEKPDLVILGFGMNDGSTHRRLPAERFAANLSRMMEAVRQENPAAEFVLLMPMQPNAVWRSIEPMNLYLPAMEGLVGPGVALADMWSLHGHLLDRKSFWDLSGNGLNHPNDFLARVYAQVLLAVLGVE